MDRSTDREAKVLPCIWTFGPHFHPSVGEEVTITPVGCIGTTEGHAVIFTAMPPALENAKVLGLPARSLVVLGAVLIVAVHLGLRVFMVPQYRTELGGVEHNAVHGIQKMLLGIQLYQDPESAPFDVIQYTPAYFVLCATVGRIAGTQGDDARSVFLLSRIIALVLTLLSCWIILRICLSAGAPMWAAVLAAVLTCCAYTEHFYARPDALQSFASLTALWYFMRWSAAPRTVLLAICAGFAVLGFFAKQSGIVMIAVPALYLLLHRNWRALGQYVGIIVGLLLVGFALIFMDTTPVLLWKNTVQGLANGYSTMMWGELFEPATYKYFIGWHLLAVLVSALGLGSKDPVMRLLALAVPLAVFFGLITGLKSGSRLNYIHEGLTLIFIGTAIALGPGRSFRWKNHVAWGFALYALIFMGFRTKSVAHWAGLDGPAGARYAEYEADLAVRDVLLDELGLRPNEYIFITYRDYLEHFLVHQSVMTQKDIIRFSTSPLYDYTAFHDAMRDGTVRFVITDDASRPISLLDSTYTGWTPIREVAGRTILSRTPDH